MNFPNRRPPCGLQSSCHTSRCKCRGYEARECRSSN